MFYTYDTKDFTEADYEKFAALRGFSSRQSHAGGEKNRGRIISADRLIYPSPEAVIAALPEGYIIKESEFSASEGTIQKLPEAADTVESRTENTACTVSRYPDESTAVDAVKRTIAARGAQAGLSLLSSLTVTEVIKKSESVLICIEEILSDAKKTDYAQCNIFDIFQTIPKLRVSYWENEKKRNQLQEQFDKLVCGVITLTDIRNPFDHIYLKGLCRLLHIEL